jgi:hypothetical protein
MKIKAILYALLLLVVSGIALAALGYVGDMLLYWSMFKIEMLGFPDLPDLTALVKDTFSHFNHFIFTKCTPLVWGIMLTLSVHAWCRHESEEQKLNALTRVFLVCWLMILLFIAVIAASCLFPLMVTLMSGAELPIQTKILMYCSKYCHFVFLVCIFYILIKWKRKS